MRKYVLASHGHMAEGIKSTLEIIVGPQEDLICINAYTKECQDPLPEFKKIIENNPEDDIVFMTDMFGGTPSNLAMSVIGHGNFDVIAGTNLPMLIKLASARNTMSLADCVICAQEAGKKYINVASQLLNGNVK